MAILYSSWLACGHAPWVPAAQGGAARADADQLSLVRIECSLRSMARPDGARKATWCRCGPGADPSSGHRRRLRLSRVRGGEIAELAEAGTPSRTGFRWRVDVIDADGRRPPHSRPSRSSPQPRDEGTRRPERHPPAAPGGYADLAMANRSRPPDRRLIRPLRSRRRRAAVPAGFLACVTRTWGPELTEMAELLAAGAAGFSTTAADLQRARAAARASLPAVVVLRYAPREAPTYPCRGAARAPSGGPCPGLFSASSPVGILLSPSDDDRPDGPRWPPMRTRCTSSTYRRANRSGFGCREAGRSDQLRAPTSPA